MAEKSSIWRSIGAVVAGFLVNAIPATIIDVILHATKFYAPMGQPMDDPQSAVATSYRIVLGVLGSYVAARLAPQKPMAHALALGTFGLVLCTAAAVGTWNMNLGPHWYSIALAVVTLPCAWLGGRLAENKGK